MTDTSDTSNPLDEIQSNLYHPNRSDWPPPNPYTDSYFASGVVTIDSYNGHVRIYNNVIMDAVAGYLSVMAAVHSSVIRTVVTKYRRFGYTSYTDHQKVWSLVRKYRADIEATHDITLYNLELYNKSLIRYVDAKIDQWRKEKEQGNFALVDKFSVIVQETA